MRLCNEERKINTGYILELDLIRQNDRLDRGGVVKARGSSRLS